jgi:histidyl-tRNA synthetase
LKDTFKYKKDVKLFYVQECFRGERPQNSRYRQFTQLGVEIINPTKDYIKEIADLMMYLLGEGEFELNMDVSRGQNYYKEGRGFEISCDKLGSSKQICGGGEYENGVGAALGIDRILNIKK